MTDWHIRRKDVMALVDAMENDESVPYDVLSAALVDLWDECHARGKLIDTLYNALYAGQSAIQDVDVFRERIGDPR